MPIPSTQQELLNAWNHLISCSISTEEQLLNLKNIAAQMYQQGLFRRIVADLNQSNLKTVFISALLKDYTFNEENHIYLELASHLLFFNKSADIFLSYDQFPNQAELQAILQKYSKETERDSFYLIFTLSAQVIYFNKLTNEARVFICAHNGWGIDGCSKDHIFSVLLYRRCAHVDALVDIPDIGLAEGVNLKDPDQLKQVIGDGSLLLAFYRTYFQKEVDYPKKYNDFIRPILECDHSYKTNPEGLAGNYRGGVLVDFLDYIQERLFPLRDNYIYNSQSDDRKLIELPSQHYQTPIDTTSLPEFKVTRVIATRCYDDEYQPIGNKNELVAFLTRQPKNMLAAVDRGETILERLDYRYLYDLLSENGTKSLTEVLSWFKDTYSEHKSYIEIQQQVSDIYTEGQQKWLNMINDLHIAFKIAYKTQLNAGLSSFFHCSGLDLAQNSLLDIIQHAQFGSKKGSKLYTGKRSAVVLRDLKVLNSENQLNPNYPLYGMIKTLMAQQEKQNQSMTLDDLHKAFKQAYKTKYNQGYFVFFHRSGIKLEQNSMIEMIHHALHGSKKGLWGHSGKRSLEVLQDLNVLNSDKKLNPSHPLYSAINALLTHKSKVEAINPNKGLVSH